MKPTSDAIAVAVLAALLLFVALNLQAGWVFAEDALLIGLLAVGGLSARAGIRGLTVTRQMSPEAFEGDAVTVALTVAVRRGRRYFVELRDAVPGLTTATAVVAVCDVRRPATVAYQATAQGRGVYQVESLEIRSSGLAGLFISRRHLEVRGAITIFPRYWPLAEFPVPGQMSTEATVTPRPTRDGLDVVGVREFRDGDSLRHIHWRSTARRGALVVREFERADHRPVTLLLDTRAGAYAAAGGGEAFEDLVRAAASIAYAVTQSGRAAHLVAASGQTPLSAVTGWMESLHWLARVQPDGGLSLAEVYTAALQPGTAVVVCSPDADAVGILAQRSIPVAAVLVDVASYAAASRVPGSAGSSRSVPGGAGAGTARDNAVGSGETLLQALGVPVAALRHGEEVGACLRSFNRSPA